MQVIIGFYAGVIGLLFSLPCSVFQERKIDLPEDFDGAGNQLLLAVNYVNGIPKEICIEAFELLDTTPISLKENSEPDPVLLEFSKKVREWRDKRLSQTQANSLAELVYSKNWISLAFQSPEFRKDMEFSKEQIEQLALIHDSTLAIQKPVFGIADEANSYLLSVLTDSQYERLKSLTGKYSLPERKPLVKEGIAFLVAVPASQTRGEMREPLSPQKQQLAIFVVAKDGDGSFFDFVKRPGKSTGSIRIYDFRNPVLQMEVIDEAELEKLFEATTKKFQFRGRIEGVIIPKVDVLAIRSRIAQLQARPLSERGKELHQEFIEQADTEFALRLLQVGCKLDQLPKLEDNTPAKVLAQLSNSGFTEILFDEELGLAIEKSKK